MGDDTCAESSSIPPDSMTDRLLRNYGCELIQGAGILLQLSAVTVATAQTILHQFYIKRNHKEFDIRATAATACFLASKLHENARKAKDVARVFDYLLNHKKPPYVCIRNLDEILSKEILRIELEILVEFGFRLDRIMISPHRYVLQYVYALFRDLDKYSNHDVNQIAQKAWGYLNDCMRTGLCCKKRPGVIAVGCINMAAKSFNIPLTKESNWFTVFDTSWEDILLVSEELEQLYAMGKATYVDVNSPGHKDLFAFPESSHITDGLLESHNRDKNRVLQHTDESNMADQYAQAVAPDRYRPKSRSRHDQHSQRHRGYDRIYDRDSYRDYDRYSRSKHSSRDYRRERHSEDGRRDSPFGRSSDRRSQDRCRKHTKDRRSSSRGRRRSPGRSPCRQRRDRF